VVILPDQLQININSKALSPAHIRLIAEPRLKRFAYTLIRSELSRLCSQFDFTYSRLSLKNQKSVFGSCSSKNNLNFNWQIIFFPPDKFRHILLHELTHLLHRNHSRDYWRQLAVYDPDYAQNNRWLKTSGIRFLLFR
jgi:predicted metal-dependent hydrolase